MVQEVRGGFINGELEVTEKITVRDLFVERIHQPVEPQHLHAADQLVPPDEPQAHRGDDAEAAVAADHEAEKFGVLRAAAAMDGPSGIHQRERLHVIDERPHGQATAVDVRGQSAAERHVVGARLLLADCEWEVVAGLLCDECVDEIRPLDASAGFDRAWSMIDEFHMAQLAEIDQQRIRSELLPAHRVACTADGDQGAFHGGV